MSGLSGVAPAPPSDDILYGFVPDPARGRFLDARMHHELAASLSHLAEASAATPDVAAPLADAAQRLAAGQLVGPEAFARYFQIAAQLLADEPSGLPEHLAALTREIATPRGGLTVVPRGGAGELDALMELRMGAEAADFALSSAAKAEALKARLAEAFALMKQALPDLHGELTAITHRVVAAEGRKDSKFQFDGASHYQFWGMLLLNPAFHPTRLALAEVLTHEISHSLLFGLTIDAPLVFNPDDALYPSPLRADDRPMDGIYHAAYVSARMAWAMENLAASPHLTPEERTDALNRAAEDRANFAAGYSVVEAHGDLSDAGAAIMSRAAAWIAAPH
ncbi:HEXXH motif-containing putative peptide modification protein [Vannielia sp.]|uniref:aKG-HExxH-type peptide beta-hydroxylase n=1 Tax=Vannielia sp. TaxID=2813045 RepID=UPI002629D2A8|nr:HEXXH motif-containing putative peptide modification protein [Vannielia sp.]MDF1872008.1 HEXXH motif-containing putative peptide modification protein [Vannielia sp.]